ncbi:MAG: hypothetical protein ACRCZU_01110 [Selenomonadaceae bacterium]
MEELNLRILDEFVREEGSEEEKAAWKVVKEKADGIKPQLCDVLAEIEEKGTPCVLDNFEAVAIEDYVLKDILSKYFA